MKNKSQKVLDHVINLVKHYREILLLNGWDFQIEVVKKIKRDTGDLKDTVTMARISAIDNISKTATLRICEDLPEPLEHRDVVIHELAHIILEPLTKKVQEEEERIAWQISKIIKIMEDT